MLTKQDILEQLKQQIEELKTDLDNVEYGISATALKNMIADKEFHISIMEGRIKNEGA